MAKIKVIISLTRAKIMVILSNLVRIRVFILFSDLSNLL